MKTQTLGKFSYANINKKISTSIIIIIITHSTITKIRKTITYFTEICIYHIYMV